MEKLKAATILLSGVSLEFSQPGNGQIQRYLIWFVVAEYVKDEFTAGNLESEGRV
jgi:hypothetical protein